MSIRFQKQPTSVTSIDVPDDVKIMGNDYTEVPRPYPLYMVVNKFTLHSSWDDAHYIPASRVPIYPIPQKTEGDGCSMDDNNTEKN